MVKIALKRFVDFLNDTLTEYLQGRSVGVRMQKVFMYDLKK